MAEQNTAQADLRFPLPAPVSRVLTLLCDAGYEAFLVGGCVRDHLRGVLPQDYDLTTNARPEEMHKVFAGLRMIDTGIQHGTVTVVVDGMAMEVTTYRVDGDYRDNRHPDEVRFTASLREDVARRDFTVNALAYHPALGIRDYFEGCADLRARRIRAVGDPRRRFEEDALRILRALRFSSVLGFSIEEETAAAARERAPLLTGISAERVQVELKKLLCGRNVQEVLSHFADILATVLPAWGEKALATPDAIFPLAAYVAAAPATPVARFAALFRDLDAQQADCLMAELRFDRRSRERVGKLLSHRADPCTGEAATLRRFVASLGGEDACLLLELHLAEAITAPVRDSAREAALAAARAAVEALLAEGACCSVRDLAITGDDLIALGCRPGRELGLALKGALSAVLDGRVENQKEALLSYCKAHLLS